jgi:LCP family protein required for cell wall assembly
MMDGIKRPIITSESRSGAPASRPSLLKPQTRRKRRGGKILLAIILLAILGLGGFLVARAADLSGKIFVGEKTSFFSKLSSALLGQTGNVKLEGESKGQVNVLLLGIGGPGHDGPYLSDTMIVAQIRPDEKKATLVSIPRDYQVNLGQSGFRKINNSFAEGFDRNDNWDEGGRLAREAASQVSGLDIPYFAVVDFQGFEKAIDLMGGVDVTVDRTFTDYSFPNDATKGYLPPVTFEAGSEHMNGERALVFARSRHAAGAEGSDFARSQRQQKIINAAKTKATELNLLTDIGKINDLLDVVGDHVHTNINPGEMIRLYNLTKDYGPDNISSLSLDPSTGIICPQILESNGAYVLTLCPGKTKADLYRFFTNGFTNGKMVEEQSVVWLADSTPGQKLYKAAQQQLEAGGLTVYQVTYGGKPILQNVVYQLNPKPATLQFIKDALRASEVTLAPPGIKADKEKVDVIVILGANTP